MYDPLKRMAKWDVNSFGQARNLVDPLNQTTTVSYDSIAGRLPLPAITQYASGTADSTWYVAGTPLVSKQRLAGDSVVNFLYGAKAQVDSVWGPGRTAEYRGYTTDGVLQWIRYGATSPLNDGVLATFSYNGLGRISSYTDPGKHTTTYSYDSATGNADSVSTPGGPFALARFDAYGRATLSRASGQVAAQVTYDVLNRIHTAWQAGVANDTVVTTYDSLYPVRVRDPGGEVYKVEVNALGWATKRYDSGDTTKYESFRYDSAGEVTSYTNRRGQRVDLTYDIAGRLLTRAAPGIVADSFGYSPDGLRFTSVRKNVERDSTFLSPLGRPDSVVRLVAGHRYTIVYGYEAYAGSGGGGRVTVAVPNNAGINFAMVAYNMHNGYPATDSLVVNGAVSELAHDQDGFLASTHWPSPGFYYHWAHTANHQAYLIKFDSSTFLNDSLARSFAYDSAGRIINDWRPLFGALKYAEHRFAYDTLGELLKVGVWRDSSGVTCSSAGTDTLAFGAAITCQNSAFVGTQDSASYDTKRNRLFPGAVYSNTGNQLLQGPTGWSYTYDADRNLATRTHGGVIDSLFWSATGLLDSVSSGTLHQWYEYNPDGTLVRRSTRVGTGAWTVDRYFLWDGPNMFAELDYPGTHRRAQYAYAGVDEPFAIVTDSAGGSRVRYFYDDPEGNLSGIMHDASSLDQFRTYSAWGQALADSSNTLADTNRLGWKGLMYMGDSTRLYYVRTRWYDPTAGRFIGEDPIGVAGGLNLYAFAANDPIDGRDPSGMTGDPCGPEKDWVPSFDGDTMSSHIAHLPTVTTSCPQTRPGDPFWIPAWGPENPAPWDPGVMGRVGGLGGPAGADQTARPSKAALVQEKVKQKEIACRGEAFWNNALALGLDVTALGFDVFVPESEVVKLGAGLAISAVGTINAAFHRDGPGIGLGMTSNLKEPFAAAIPEKQTVLRGAAWTFGAAVDGATLVHDIQMTRRDYAECMAKP